MNDIRWQDNAAFRERKRLYNAQFHLHHKYGISMQEYQEMFAKQNGVCAICKQAWKRRLYVDHDHGTGKVRALLCHTCNHLLGLIEENESRLENALCYLAKHRD